MLAKVEGGSVAVAGIADCELPSSHTGTAVAAAGVARAAAPESVVTEDTAVLCRGVATCSVRQAASLRMMGGK